MIEDAKGTINRIAELILFYRLVKEVGGAEVANSFFRLFALVSADNDYWDMLGLGGHVHSAQTWWLDWRAVRLSRSVWTKVDNSFFVLSHITTRSNVPSERVKEKE